MTEIIIPSTSTDAEGLTRYDGGKWNSRNVMAADRLIKAKEKAFEGASKKVDSPVWEVLDEVIKVWEELRPGEYKSSIIDIDWTRGMLDDKEFGRAGDTKGTGDLRRTLDVPVFVELTMRRLFTTDELPFDKSWYKELWKRVPRFRVSQKI